MEPPTFVRAFFTLLPGLLLILLLSFNLHEEVEEERPDPKGWIRTKNGIEVAVSWQMMTETEAAALCDSHDSMLIHDNDVSDLQLKRSYYWINGCVEPIEPRMVRHCEKARPVCAKGDIDGYTKRYDIECPEDWHSHSEHGCYSIMPPAIFTEKNYTKARTNCNEAGALAADRWVVRRVLGQHPSSTVLYQDGTLRLCDENSCDRLLDITVAHEPLYYACYRPSVMMTFMVYGFSHCKRPGFRALRNWRELCYATYFDTYTMEEATEVCSLVKSQVLRFSEKRHDVVPDVLRKMQVTMKIFSSEVSGCHYMNFDGKNEPELRRVSYTQCNHHVRYSVVCWYDHNEDLKYHQ